MAFKMKGPSLLKMVKQMKENSPMKKDGGKVETAMSKKENTQTGDLDYKGGSFESAFADAKKSGARVFTHNDKKYTTQTKKEKEMDDALVKIPKKKIKPLPVKKDKPDPDSYDVNYEDSSDPDKG